jgi:hypothetical protein
MYLPNGISSSAEKRFGLAVMAWSTDGIGIVTSNTAKQSKLRA